ncbi:MAG: methyltransferase domain-containing protein [Deltaproteobacteria bacterium]|nr:methyltransferase domain-containing protein [Deltaproteobacteria bacterium]
MRETTSSTLLQRARRAASRWLLRSATAYRLYERWSFHAHQAAIARSAAGGDLRLHLGCGGHLLEGWINIDLRPQRGTLSMRLPAGLQRFADDSVRAIYASHVLEHLDYPGQALEFVRQCHRILRPGGALRVIVPGVQKIIEAYARNDAGFFEVQAQLHPPECTTPLEHLMYALQQGGEHRYGYDLATIAKLYARAGFSEVIASDHNASQVPELRVDYHARQDNHGNYLSLYVDAVKR